jgi:hypothetical protein
MHEPLRIAAIHFDKLIGRQRARIEKFISKLPSALKISALLSRGLVGPPWYESAMICK